MAVTPHIEPSLDPVLPHSSRVQLLSWFAVQWIIVPVDFVARTIWLIVVFLGDGTEDMLARLVTPLARWLSPGKLLLRMSHDPARHEAYLDRKFARVALEIDRRKFSWGTKIAHRVGQEVHPDGYRLGVQLHPREYRGVPLSTLKRLASAHALVLEASTDLKDGVVLRQVHAKDSW
ncbi:hypothetical protein ACFY2T_32920 [Streptomyces sp. NPDC001260]|uniref:hypothetical protein n=1 Tax=Streptomyces sp. NPDC001260 TaxID=3364551 RepID=UPI00368FF399